MRELPYMPYWVADEGSKTSHLSFEEEGAYIRLLRICWLSEGCQIPDDQEWINRRVRARTKREKLLVRKVLREFFVIEEGAWRDHLLRQRYKTALCLTQKKEEAGRLGGKASALKRKNSESSSACSVVGAPLQQAISKQEPESNSNAEAKQVEVGLRALVEMVRSAVGPGAAPCLLSEDISSIVDAWWELGARPLEIVRIVRERTALARRTPIRSLRALQREVADSIKTGGFRPSNAAASAAVTIEMPTDESARECLEEILRTYGQTTAAAWLLDAVWTDDEVIVPNAFACQKVETIFGGVLRSHGFSARASRPECLQ